MEAHVCITESKRKKKNTEQRPGWPSNPGSRGREPPPHKLHPARRIDVADAPPPRRLRPGCIPLHPGDRVQVPVAPRPDSKPTKRRRYRRTQGGEGLGRRGSGGHRGMSPDTGDRGCETRDAVSRVRSIEVMIRSVFYVFYVRVFGVFLCCMRCFCWCLHVELFIVLGHLNKDLSHFITFITNCRFFIQNFCY